MKTRDALDLLARYMQAVLEIEGTDFLFDIENRTHSEFTDAELRLLGRLALLADRRALEIDKIMEAKWAEWMKEHSNGSPIQ